MAGRQFGKFCKFLQFAKLKTIQISSYNNTLLADLFIHPTFSAKHLKGVNLPNILPTKLSVSQLEKINVL